METSFCHLCPDDPGIRKIRGCDGPTQVSSKPRKGEWPLNIPDCRGKNYEYYVCPSALITATVDGWYERYEFIKRYPQTQVPFDQVPIRDRLFERYYLSIKDQLHEISTKGSKEGKD